MPSSRGSWPWQPSWPGGAKPTTPGCCPTCVPASRPGLARSAGHSCRTRRWKTPTLASAACVSSRRTYSIRRARKKTHRCSGSRIGCTSRTRDATVQDQLLFHSGDSYDGRLLEESERILRGTRYLQDAQHPARRVARRRRRSSKSITHDVWTLNPDVSFGRKGGQNSSGFGVEELNLLGLGTQVSLGRKSDVDRTSTTLLYHDPQLFRSWWTLTARLLRQQRRPHGTVRQSSGRSMRSIRAGPPASRRATTIASIRATTSARSSISSACGTVMPPCTAAGHRACGTAGRTRLTYGFTYDETRFERIVGETGPTSLLPQDRKLAYPWIGYEWIQDDYEKTRNRDQIEKTEDFLLGLHAHARLGICGVVVRVRSECVGVRYGRVARFRAGRAASDAAELVAHRAA